MQDKDWNPKMGVRSTHFYNSDTVQLVVYENEEQDPQFAPPNESILLKGFKGSKIIATNYQRAPKMEAPPHMSLKPGEYLTIIKYVGHLKTGGDSANLWELPFSFVYKGYEEVLGQHRKILTDHCSSVEGNEIWRPKSIFEVPIGGIFAIKVEDIYARVRIVKLNFETRDFTYWAVDEGIFGTCTAKELIYLPDECLILSMLVVPGVFEKDPKPSQLTKFEEKKFALAIVKQPTLGCDHGSRKISLV